MELWVAGQSDVYTLEAKTKKAKEDFAAELRKVGHNFVWPLAFSFYRCFCCHCCCN